MKYLIKKILREEVLYEVKINKKNLLTVLNDVGLFDEDADDELNNLLRWFKLLPNELTLYRILRVDNESDINLKEPGKHYSTNRVSLIKNNTHTLGYGDKKFLLTVKAKKSQIDIQETLTNNILYPNEEEITLKNRGKSVRVISVEELK